MPILQMSKWSRVRSVSLFHTESPWKSSGMSHCTRSLAPSKDALSIGNICSELLKNNGRYFTKEGTGMTNNGMRSFSTLLVVREMQIKIMGYTHSYD